MYYFYIKYKHSFSHLYDPISPFTLMQNLYQYIIDKRVFSSIFSVFHNVQYEFSFVDDWT